LVAPAPPAAAIRRAAWEIAVDNSVKKTFANVLVPALHQLQQFEEDQNPTKLDLKPHFVFVFFTPDMSWRAKGNENFSARICPFVGRFFQGMSTGVLCVAKKFAPLSCRLG